MPAKRRSIRLWRHWFLSSLAILILLILLLVARQASNQTETTMRPTPAVASAVITEGSTFTIGWKLHLNKITVVRRDDDGFLTAEGAKIPYTSVSFVRIGDVPSIPKNEWNSRRHTLDKLKLMVADGQSIWLVQKVPPPFEATIKKKSQDGFTTTDGTFVLYEEVGYITRPVPFMESFPKTLARDVEKAPLFVVWALTDLISALSHSRRCQHR